jgi:hypothetical protein
MMIHAALHGWSGIVVAFNFIPEEDHGTLSMVAADGCF